ncbi:MAG TPA: biotin/lipoyl-binding protein, partial [Thermoanaerobaculia bacterium]|nr:biotin/lipoyl-binding protein [Thermoanaerobaculia bacterium]
MRSAARWLVPAVGIALLAAFVAQARDRATPPEAALAPARLASNRVVAEGRLAAYPGAEVVVAADVAGIVARLPVEERALVAKGALLAELRAEDLRAELAAARARVAETEAEIRLAETELARAESLYAQHVDSAARRDRSRRDLDVATARRATAAADADRLAARLAKYRIA